MGTSIRSALGCARMRTYGENFGKGMLIGCAFTFVMTLGMSPLSLSNAGDELTARILVTVGYLILGAILGYTGIVLRKEKSDSMPHVIGKATTFVSIAFIMIGICGLLGNYSISPGVDYGLFIYVTVLVMGILVMIGSRLCTTTDVALPSMAKVLLLVAFAVTMVLSLLAFCDVPNQPMAGPNFNTVMISLVFIVYILKGVPKVAAE